MKLAEIEDADKLVTKEYFDIRLNEMEHRISDQFHKELLASTRWAIIVLVGFSGLILGGTYFMLVHFKP